MTRAVDKLPDPRPSRRMRVVGIGASRTGTLGLWEAFRVLGYRPFHITELLPHDIRKMQALQEAMTASRSDKPFSLPEFSRIWGTYDVLIESPCYLGISGIQTYLDDPEVKFVLTERSTESWVKSISGSLVTYYVKFNKFPLCIVRYCDRFVWELERMFGLMTMRWSGGLNPRDAAFSSTIAKSYEEYNAMVKSLIPPERLLVLDLGKGFGWDDICPFLECEVPDTPYPRSNTMQEFHAAAEMVIQPAKRKTVVILSSSVVAAIGVVAFWAWKMD